MTSKRMVIDALEMPVPERRWFEEWKAGGVSCVQCTVAVWENARETLSLIGRWKRAFQENSDLIACARTGQDIVTIAESGRTAVVLGFQNTAPFEHDLDLVGIFHDLGVRVAQLTYNLQNYIGSGYWEETDTGISSRFGRNVIAEMNRVGMLIDASHCGDKTTADAIAISERPMAITHANPREYVGTPGFGPGRLTRLEDLKALAAKGGVVGLSMNRFLTKEGDKNTGADFADMVAWTVDRIGVDSVGMGVDYCPGHSADVRTWWRYARWSHEKAAKTNLTPHEGWPAWFQGPRDFPHVTEALVAKGFSDAEIGKIMGDNWLRLFSQSFQPA